MDRTNHAEGGDVGVTQMPAPRAHGTLRNPASPQQRLLCEMVDAAAGDTQHRVMEVIELLCVAEAQWVRARRQVLDAFGEMRRGHRRAIEHYVHTADSGKE